MFSRFEVIGFGIALLCAILAVLVDKNDQDITRQRVAEGLGSLEEKTRKTQKPRLLKDWEHGPMGL